MQLQREEAAEGGTNGDASCRQYLSEVPACGEDATAHLSDELINGAIKYHALHTPLCLVLWYVDRVPVGGCRHCCAVYCLYTKFARTSGGMPGTIRRKNYPYPLVSLLFDGTPLGSLPTCPCVECFEFLTGRSVGYPLHG